MNLLVIGASGKAGTCILAQARDRGHQAVGLARRPGSILVEGVEVRYLDALALTMGDLDQVDVLVDAALPAPGLDWPPLVRVRHLVPLCLACGKRYLLIGHAGCLWQGDGRWHASTSCDLTDRERAAAQAQAVDWLEGLPGDWLICHPDRDFNPAGRASGRYRLAADVLPDRPGIVSYADFASAILDLAAGPEKRSRSHLVTGFRQ